MNLTPLHFPSISVYYKYQTLLYKSFSIKCRLKNYTNLENMWGSRWDLNPEIVSLYFLKQKYQYIYFSSHFLLINPIGKWKLQCRPLDSHHLGSPCYIPSTLICVTTPNDGFKIEYRYVKNRTKNIKQKVKTVTITAVQFTKLQTAWSRVHHTKL